LLCVSAGSLFAQDAGNEEDVRKEIHSPYRISIRGNAMVPHPTSNPAFRHSFNGVYDATLSVNLELYKGLTIGGMYKNSGFQTPPNKIPQLNTKQQYNVGGVRLGYDYFISKVFVFSPGICMGQCYIKSYDMILLYPSDKIQQNDQGFYMEPELALSFYTEDDFAIGFNLSYEIVNTQFDPYKLALEQHIVTGYKPSDLIGTTQNFNIGFHFVYSFWKKGRKKH
jgi:hypothetical protein